MYNTLLDAPKSKNVIADITSMTSLTYFFGKILYD